MRRTGLAVLLLTSSCNAHLPPPRSPLVATPIGVESLPPMAGDQGEMALPALESWQEPNGLQVFVLPRPGPTPVTLTLALPGLSMGQDPAAAARTLVLSKLLDGRGLGRVAGSMAQEADAAALRIEATPLAEGTTLTLTASPEELSLALRWLDEAAAHPALDKAWVEAAAATSQGVLREQSQSLGGLSRHVLLEQLYGARVIASISDMGRAVSSIQPDELARHHKRWVAAQGAALFVSGTVSAEQVKKLVASTLARWPAGEGPPPRRTELWPAPVSRMNVILDRSLIEFLYVALPAPMPGSPDRPAAELLAAMLSGDMNSGMTRVVRQDASGYFAASDIEEHGAGSVILITTAVGRWRLRNAVEQVLEQLQRLAGERGSDDELEAARHIVIGKRTRALETSRQAALWFGDAWLRGRTPGEAWQDVDRAARVTPEELHTLVKNLWSGRRFAILTGADRELGSRLATLGAGDVAFWSPLSW